MTIDGEKLRNLRIQKGISQEKLGVLTNLNKRTIQRAERGDAVALETLAFIADALEVEPKALKARQHEMFSSEAQPTASQAGEVILVPASRGSRLVNLLYSAFYASFEYLTEPTDENVEILEEVAEMLNEAWQTPWTPPNLSWDQSDAATADARKIRLQARANRLLAELSEIGIAIFAGSYESWGQIPYFDIDEGMMSYSRAAPLEHMTNVLIVVSDEKVKHLSRMPDDHEVHTKPRSLQPPPDFDDEIPF